MKRPLIEVEQKVLVQCDNPDCDYTIPNETEDPYHEIDKYLNEPCPECGENLLTEEDLYKYKKMLKVIAWVNKWFGWLRIFSSKNKGYEKVGRYHTRSGIEWEDNQKE